METIFHRVSIRKYEDKPVEQEKIEKMLRAAMAAPSACNQQPWEYYVVTDKAVIERLGDLHQFFNAAKKAPVIFVPCYRNEGLIAPMYADIDLSASVQNLLLEADGLGLGACWMGVSPLADRMSAVAEILNLPENLTAFALVPCGYPAESRPQEDRYEEARVHYV